MRNALLVGLAVLGFAIRLILPFADSSLPSLNPRSSIGFYNLNEVFTRSVDPAKAKSAKARTQPETKATRSALAVANGSASGSGTTAQTAGPDPIRFRMEASKDSVSVGEEFELTITADLLPIPTQSLFTFEDQKSFSLKVLMPGGFQQTGGTYTELQKETLTPANPHRMYTLRGVAVSDVESLEFTLLRGPANATSSSYYEKKQQLTVYLKTSADPARARVAVDFACTCQDCDLDAVKLTDNPSVSATNLGSSDQNYRLENVYLDANGTNVSQTINYFDGLGRSIQQVSVASGGSPGSPTDVVSIMTYDALGREPVNYLPFAAATAGNKGAFRSANAGDVSAFYSSIQDKTGNAYSSVTFEPSPLNRIQTQTAPGNTTPVSMGYRTNTASELKLLTYDFLTKNITVSTYGAGQLYVTETTDENGNKTTEYKDKAGQIVGKDISGRKTLYAYDDFGWLRCVVPPKASANISGTFDPLAGELLFGYDYDERGRMTRKRVPGAGTTIMGYDTRDRLTNSTDAANLTVNTFYDDLDRVTSRKKDGITRIEYFYDRYGSEAKTYDAAHAYSVAAKTDNLKGMLTSTRTLVEGGSTYLINTTYYDDLGRAIQTVSDNHKSAVDRSSSKLDYIGRATETKLSTLNNLVIEKRTAYDVGSRVKSICQRVTDGASAAAGSTGQYFEPVARYNYNGIGELAQKTLGCNIQTVNYTYQMQGWMKSLNDPAANLDKSATDKRFFGMRLNYDQPGNITSWNYSNAKRSGNADAAFAIQVAQPYTYSFAYDNLNRLKGADLIQTGQSTTIFSLGGNDNGQITYDDNGNIRNLKRTYQGTVVDNMAYTYQNSDASNRIESISDAGANPSSANAFFKDGTSNYGYDATGNMTNNAGKSVTYNYLNLPRQVSYSGNTVNYTYSASGEKLTANFGSNKVYDYVAGLVYLNNQLEFIPTAEGRVLPPGKASTTITAGSSTVATNAYYRYEYHLKDHLGSLRTACRCGEKTTETSPGDTYAPLVVQEQHYDPFGLDLTGITLEPANTSNRNKFISRELQPDLGWYDLQARFFDPGFGRFMNVDPLTENQEHFSPYHYSYDNPIRFSDPDGRCPDCSEDDPYLFAKLAVTAFYDTKHAIENTILRELGSEKRVGYKVVDGQQIFETQVYQRAPVNSVGDALREAASTLLDISSIAGARVSGVTGGLLAKTSSTQTTKTIKDALIIDIPEANKIDRSLLNSPAKPGNAPTFKSDNTKVEIHHQGQKREGPFVEMHWKNHRGKENDKINHPNKGQKSEVDRKEFDKAKRQYWKREYPEIL